MPLNLDVKKNLIVKLWFAHLKLLLKSFYNCSSCFFHSLYYLSTLLTGTVIDVQVFTRDGVEKDKRALEVEDMQLREAKKDFNEEFRILEAGVLERARKLLVAAGFDEDNLASLNAEKLLTQSLAEEDKQAELEQLAAQYDELKTPVQAAVKREDEQEFARLNGQNLMFCEDVLSR